MQKPSAEEAVSSSRRCGELGEFGCGASDNILASGLVSADCWASWSACSVTLPSIERSASARCAKARIGVDSTSSAWDCALALPKAAESVATCALSAATSA